MAKKLIKNYAFTPGVSFLSNLVPNGYDVILKNKEFLKAEAISYINDQVGSSTAPFNGYVYDPVIMRTNIENALDAILFDIRYGGNSSTVPFIESFWDQDTSLIDGSRLPERAVYTFLETVITTNIITNTAVVSPYQSAVTQNITANTSEATVESSLNDLFALIDDVLATGLTASQTATGGPGKVELLDKIDLNDLLIITNTTINEVIYNFAEPSKGAVSHFFAGNSVAFPEATTISNGYTVVELNYDTSTMSSSDVLQIFLEDSVMKVRPYDFGTDAIERMRVAQPQAMIDADFEYGLQPTKWQALGLMRNYPTSYENLGTDISVNTITTDASVTTNGVGASNISVTTSSNHNLAVGDPFTIVGLNTDVLGFNRAEGSFQVDSVVNDTVFTYVAKSKVGTSSGQVLGGSGVQLRKASYYTGADIGTPTLGVVNNGSSGTFTTPLTAPSGSNILTYSGATPPTGVPLTGTGIATGTQITGAQGSGGSIGNFRIDTQTTVSDTSITFVDVTNIQQNMALADNNSSQSVITSINGNTVSLDAPIGTVYTGDTETYQATPVGIAGTGSGASFNVNVLADGTTYELGQSNVVTGSGATFDVAVSLGSYDPIDLNAGGSNYNSGDRVLLLGTDLGGASPDNDLELEINTVTDAGSAKTITITNGGTGYADAPGVGTTGGNGTGFTVDIITTTGVITSASISSGGSGYNTNDVVNVTGGNGNATITITAVTAAGEISDFQIFSPNSPAAGTDGQSFTGVSSTGTFGSGTNPKLSAGGSGYQEGDTIRILGTALGGISPDHDAYVTVTSVNAGVIDDADVTSGGGNGEAYYTSVSGSNVAPQGTGLVANVTRTGGTYQASVNTGGSGFYTGNRFKVLGSNLGGVDVTNDCTLVVDSTSQLNNNEVTGFTASGTSIRGDQIAVYSTVSISEVTTSSISSSSSISYGNIATLQISFTSAHGLVPGDSVYVSVTSAGTNHDLAGGSFFLTQVPSPTTIRYTARTVGTVDTGTTLTGDVYARPDSFFVHRPFDGGVSLGTGGPQFGASAVRQSKKYIRYQSGKGAMYNTGALFAPNFDVREISATGTSIGSSIEIITDDQDHGCQVGATIVLKGVTTTGYNGEYQVTNIIDERTVRVQANTVLGSTTPELGTPCEISVKNWRGAVVRTGSFDDQNGIFFQYDGNQLAAVLRSSTFQITGKAAVNSNSSSVTGTNTRFQDQLTVGDRIVMRGMTHTVTSISSQTAMTVAPDFRGVNNQSGIKIVKVRDTIIPQENWNIDKCDGTGPSGYDIDVTRMQMVGIQFSWYGAGFIDWMVRGPNGDYVFCHRLKGNNVNNEAYMRTGNLPVRYEVTNEGASGRLKSSINSTSTSLTLDDASLFPPSGVVYIDNELIGYSGKTANTLTGLTRSANLTNFVAGSTRSYTAGVAASHSANSGCLFVQCLASPTISHWGSAYLIDGNFDDDRGFIFSYQATNVPVTGARKTVFAIRLAPSVHNAVVGDLGERDLINRAQLLLKGIEVTGGEAGDEGNIIVEGVLNPQNYPANPANIDWLALTSPAQGGQPSFAQVAIGDNIDFGQATNIVVQTSAQQPNRQRTWLYFDTADIGNVTVGMNVTGTGIASGTTVDGIFYDVFTNGETVITINNRTETRLGAGATVTFSTPAFSLPGQTIFSFIAAPGQTNSLDLGELEELTNTSIGGTGTFPNGPDVLAINAYTTGGVGYNANVILRWGEAQA